MLVSMLTTEDNPFDPFDEFDQWHSYDLALGHNTSGMLARLVITSDELSYADQHLAIETAIEEIVSENVNGLFKKVTREVPDPLD